MDRLRPEEILARIIQGVADPAPEVRPAAPADPGIQHWTGPVLLERTAYLKKMARAGEGWAAETIREYPGHLAMLVVRLRNGPAESVEGFAQVIFVLEGRATLVTGGEIEKPRKTRLGETTGAGIEGGARPVSRQELRAGDVVHVAGGVPVQALVAGEKPFSCLLIRIREIDDE
jgi:hypothetical protein